MSDPGMTLDQYQQLQDMQKRQAMGAMLMGGNNQGANGGLANAGSSILGAALASRARDDQNNMMNQMRYNATPDQPVALPQTTGANGSPLNLGTVNAKPPMLPAQSNGWFKNLFNFGGGS